jgi:phosphonate transport system ATP-binding protein
MDEDALRKTRCHIGFVWQEYNLVERLSVISNVLTGRLGYVDVFQSVFGYFAPAQREIAIRNLERVNLLEKSLQRADSLSGGEKQRVSIARAISQQPKIILADEPVASLDPNLAWQVLNDLSRVAREDKVLTLVCIHQLELAKAFCDRVVGIAQGKVAFDGPPSRLDEDAMCKIYGISVQRQQIAETQLAAAD